MPQLPGRQPYNLRSRFVAASRCLQSGSLPSGRTTTGDAEKEEEPRGSKTNKKEAQVCFVCTCSTKYSEQHIPHRRRRRREMDFADARSR